MALRILLALMLMFTSLSCDSAKDAVDEAQDLADLELNPPSRKPINTSRLGVNNFFVDREFGSISAQYQEIQGVLKLKYIRVLFAWTDSVQPSPSSSPNFSFFDNIVANAPPGVELLVVVAHTPSWMTNSANWIDGNPRKTWVERWLRPVVSRYAGRSAITAWEIWNEPDLTVVPSDTALGLETPENYFELLQFGSAVVRSLTPGKSVVLAATESIQQSFPSKLRYNQTLRDLGAEDFVDIWNIHYYGQQFEKVIVSGGVADFLNSLTRPIWLTESGKQNPVGQLEYAEVTWPFLTENIPGIERIYYYEYGSTDGLADNYGLKTTSSEFPVSDLYTFLRDR